MPGSPDRCEDKATSLLGAAGGAQQGGEPWGEGGARLWHLPIAGVPWAATALPLVWVEGKVCVSGAGGLPGGGVYLPRAVEQVE